MEHDSHRRPTDGAIAEAAGRLSDAFDSLVTVHILLTGLPPMELPHHGLDRALLASQSYQMAREAARQAWEPIVEKADDPRAAMRAEEAVNALAVKAAELGWRLAMAAGAGRLG